VLFRESQLAHAMLFVMLPGASDAEYLFYDGHCALCHGAVKFVLRHDRSGRMFRFAPLQGETFAALVAPERRTGLPESMVVLTRDGRLLTRSDACLHVLRRLGGGWVAFADLQSAIPRALRDFVYDFVAWVRYGVFGWRDEVCPVTAPELRARFDP